MHKLLILLLFFVANIFAQNTFTDSRDGQVYKYVKIGTQTWMAENLNYKIESGSWCYDNEESNCEKYGRLYDWNTAIKVCPKGWHLPSDEEWDDIVLNGFSDLQIGGFRGIDGNFYDVGSDSAWWTATENSEDNEGAYILDINFSIDINDKSCGFSVRCVKD
jgi:hypothetical protein